MILNVNLAVWPVGPPNQITLSWRKSPTANSCPLATRLLLSKVFLHMSFSITTRRGDDGTTGLLYGQRVPKDHPQIEALGTCDELNVALGLARAGGASESANTLLLAIQKDLVALMGELACAEADAARYRESKFPKLDEASLARVDAAAAALEARSLRFDGWATPGATPLAAAFDQARTTARRCERRLTSLTAHGRNVSPLIMAYVNRLSDLLWLLAREAEQGALPPAPAVAPGVD